MLSVRVTQIQSYTDAEGRLGKIIVLVVDMEFVRPKPQTEAEVMVQQVYQGILQVIPMSAFPKSVSCPKICLFLTEEECDQLGINFEVNKTFVIALENKNIKFTQEGEG
jgi:hypothetical protein